MATCAELAQQAQVLSNLILHSHAPDPDLEAQLAAVRQKQEQQGCLKPAGPVTVRTKFNSIQDGFQFSNGDLRDHWNLDQYEKDKITDLIRAATVPVMAALTPLIAPALGIVDVIGALFGIPPGVVETVGTIALVSGGLNDMIDRILPESVGLCGGMAFASLDYFNLNIPINRVAHTPERTNQALTDLRNYIWDRLIDSFVGGVALTTLEWMALFHLVPTDLGGGAQALLDRSKSEWEILKTHLRKGEPWPIGLIGTTNNPSDNHQVVAYGFEEHPDGSGLIYIYDNIFPNVETTFWLDFSGTELQARESNPITERGPLKGFFCEEYTVKTPPTPHSDFFYTTSPSERDSAISQLGYMDGGVACYVFAAQVAGTIPFFRLRRDTHFYTTSTDERDAAIQHLGYVDEGTACYVFPTQSPGTVSLFRLQKGDHLYTTSVAERNAAVANYGYHDEGIACYVPGTGVKGATPLFRLNG